MADVNFNGLGLNPFNSDYILNYLAYANGPKEIYSWMREQRAAPSAPSSGAKRHQLPFPAPPPMQQQQQLQQQQQQQQQQLIYDNVMTPDPLATHLTSPTQPTPPISLSPGNYAIFYVIILNGIIWKDVGPPAVLQIGQIGQIGGFLAVMDGRDGSITT